MTRLLISVRDTDEALAALRGGADVIDLKEPRAGSLGAVDPREWDAIRAVADSVPTSVALGELGDPKVRDLARRTDGFHYAKLGLAGASRCRDWPRRWHEVLKELPSSVRPVAVAYADFQAARAPDPVEVLRRAVEFGCAAVLVDTFVKDGRSAFVHWPAAVLGSFVQAVHRERLLVVVGGALDASGIATACRLGPDLVAVRGAVCRGDRTGKVEQELVAALSALVRRPLALESCVAT